MKTHFTTRKEGEVLRLIADKAISDDELLQLLKTHGIEIIQGPTRPGISELAIRAPRGMSLSITRVKACRSTEPYLAAAR